MVPHPEGRSLRRAAVPVAVALVLVAAALGWWFVHQRPSGVEVYFVRSDAVRNKLTLAAVRRPDPRGPIEVRLEAALRALLDGPKATPWGDARDLATEIPAGTALLGVKIDGRIVTVNLSETYAAGGGSTSMLARVWQVVYTATQFPDAPEVQILVGGRHLEALGGEGVIIGSPLRRPAAPPSF
jgi:spore germination protein GerM